MIKTDSELLTRAGGLEAAITDAAEQEEKRLSKKPSLVQRLKNHKLIAYSGINALLSPISIASSYVSVKWLHLHEAMMNLPVLDQTGNYLESFTAAAAGGITDFAVDLAAAPVLYAINSGLYNKQNRVQEFGKRYLAFTLVTKGIDTAAAGIVLGTMLTLNVPPSVAFISAGKVTWPVTVPARIMLYNAVVLKSHPVPETVRGAAGNIAAAISRGIGRLAYTTTVFMPKI